MANGNIVTQEEFNRYIKHIEDAVDKVLNEDPKYHSRAWTRFWKEIKEYKEWKEANVKES